MLHAGRGREKSLSEGDWLHVVRVSPDSLVLAAIFFCVCFVPAIHTCVPPQRCTHSLDMACSSNRRICAVDKIL